MHHKIVYIERGGAYDCLVNKHKIHYIKKGGNIMSSSSLVDYTLLSPNNSGKRTHKIDRITPHCFVGQVTAERGAEVFASKSKQASCQYVIAKDGRVALVCDEDNRSWCTSSNSNDQRAITIECASDIKSPYAFTDACYNKLIDLTVDICKRYGKTKLVWINNKEQALAYEPKDNELQVTVHRWFANKSCPGDWLMSRMDDYVAKVNSRLNNVVQPAPSAPSAPSNEDKKYYRVRLSWADAKSQLGAYENFDNAKEACKTGYAVYDWNGNEVYSNRVETPKVLVDGDVITLKEYATYLDGRAIPSWVTKSTLYYRGRNSKGIMFSTQKTGAITGVISESAINGLGNNSSTSTNSVANNKFPYKVKVTADALNYRKGPGVSYGINGTITDRGIYTIVDEVSGWGKLKSGAGWINLKYTSRV